MIRFPTEEEISTAIAWLRVNDGGDGESDRCVAVAEYLRLVADDRTLRLEARKAGITVATLRRRITGRV